MEHIYPAVFHANSDGSYTVTFPDLPGCTSEGKSLENALYMAQVALVQWIGYLSDKKLEIPQASQIQDIKAQDSEFVNLIRAELGDRLTKNGAIINRPTLEQIEQLPKEILSAVDVSSYLGTNPSIIRWQARNEPEKLGFPVIVMKSRVKIPKEGFVFYCRYGRLILKKDGSIVFPRMTFE